MIVKKICMKRDFKINKLLTKPYSRIDKFILSLLIMLIVMHFYFWLDYRYRYLDGFLWLTIPTKIVFVVVTISLTYLLYWNLYSKEKKLLRLQKKVFNQLYTHYKSMNESKAIKLIDDICNATIVPIEDRKPLYDKVVKYLLNYFPDYEEVQPSVTKRWKMAVIEYKKYEILND